MLNEEEIDTDKPLTIFHQYIPGKRKPLQIIVFGRC